MKIYLAYAVTGGWTILSLSLKKKQIMASFYYDSKEIKNLNKRLKHEENKQN